jgi:putative Mg2+ transporter-C (MgtC) family protein
MPDTLTISMTDVAIRLGVAALLGLAIGLERERLDRAAGLRTHALVCLSAALIMIVSAYGFTDALDLSNGNVSLDPSRVAAQVVSGVGFLGAGVIIFRRNAIHGLTTAASLWAIAGIGLACGGGLIWPAVLATGIILAIQSMIRPIEMRYSSKRSTHHFSFGVEDAAAGIVAIETELRNQDVIVNSSTLMFQMSAATVPPPSFPN